MFVLGKLLLYFQLLTFSFTAPPFSENAATLIAQSIELLQKNENDRALKRLEKAFEIAHDPAELKEIANLIVEASPKNYPKREAYLRYLVRLVPEHPEFAKWCRDLGDAAFEKARFQEAEDWFLRALKRTQEKAPLQFKLAYVYWNLKQPREALDLFLLVYQNSKGGLQTQVLKDLPKLWIEIGSLPQKALKQITAFPKAHLNELARILFERLNTQISPKEEQVLKEFERSEKLRPFLALGLQNERFKRKAPCLAFQLILKPEDAFDPSQLLACRKKNVVSSAELLPFFLRIASTDENFMWAEMEILMELERLTDAARRFIELPDFRQYSRDFLRYGESILLRLDEGATRELILTVGRPRFENFLNTFSSNLLLGRLQAIDPDTWIPFEAASYETQPPKSFLLKQGVWLARKNPIPLKELDEVFQELITPPLSSETRVIVKSYQDLTRQAETKLPPTFSKAFKAGFDSWIRALDRSMEALQRTPTAWQILSTPIFQQEIEKNVKVMISQIEAATLDPELSELSETFDQKKAEIKDQLRQKYLETP